MFSRLTGGSSEVAPGDTGTAEPEAAPMPIDEKQLDSTYEIEVVDPGMMDIVSRAFTHATGGIFSPPETTSYPDRPHLCWENNCEARYANWESTCIEMVEKQREKDAKTQEIYDTLTTVVLGALFGILVGVLND